MIPWYPNATRDSMPDAGAFLGGPYRGVLHTTESSSYTSARAAYVKNNSAPHFTVDAQGRVWQHVPLDRAARALKNVSGGVETNRAPAIQIEVVAKAETPTWPAAQVAAMRDLMKWIEAQTGVRPVAPAFKSYPSSYGANGIRFSASTWSTWNGWCGHQHVPENSHGDPGAIDIKSLLVRGVRPMFDPPVPITSPVVATLQPENRVGLWMLTLNGAIYAWGGAPDYDAPNRHPEYWNLPGQTAAQLLPWQGGYMVVDNEGRTYGYPAS